MKWNLLPVDGLRDQTQLPYSGKCGMVSMPASLRKGNKEGSGNMSAQIRNEREGYYSILEETQKGTLDITEWILWFLQCLQRALATTHATLADVIRKSKFWERPAAQTLNERQRLMLHKMLDGFEGKVTSSKWAKITKVSQDTAVRDLQDLLERGLLGKEAAGGRSTSYVLEE